MTTPILPARSESGFTLIETRVYLVLFTIIIGGVLLAAYQILQASSRSQEQALIQEEANFISSKINWALTGASAINEPPLAGSGPNLDIVKYDATTVVFSADVANTDLKYSKYGAGPYDLNSDSIKVEHVDFTHTDDLTDSKPAEIQATFRLTSKLTGQFVNATTTKYLR